MGKKLPETLTPIVQDWAGGQSIKLMFQDEAQFGRISGWHRTAALKAPQNIYLLRLPPYAPELHPIEHAGIYYCIYEIEMELRSRGHGRTMKLKIQKSSTWQA